MGAVFGSEKPIKKVIKKTMLAQVSVQNAVLTANKYVEMMNGKIIIE